MNGKGARKATRWVDTESPDKEPSDDILCHVHTVDSQRVNPYKVVLELDGSPILWKLIQWLRYPLFRENSEVSLSHCRITQAWTDPLVNMWFEKVRYSRTTSNACDRPLHTIETEKCADNLCFYIGPRL